MNVNAIIANMGNGNVSTGNIITGDVRQTNTVNNEKMAEFIKVLNELKTSVDAFGDKTAKQTVELIQEETKKNTWDKKVIGFMLDTLQKTGVALAAKGLAPLVSKALALLPLI